MYNKNNEIMTVFMDFAAFILFPATANKVARNIALSVKTTYVI